MLHCGVFSVATSNETRKMHAKLFRRAVSLLCGVDLLVSAHSKTTLQSTNLLFSFFLNFQVLFLQWRMYPCRSVVLCKLKKEVLFLSNSLNNSFSFV
jgi:hypothetical protein